MRIGILVICSALLFLLIHPAFSTQLTLEEELLEIYQTWELGLKISREGLAESRAEVTGLKAELSAYENIEKMLKEESRGLKADSTKLRLDLISVGKQKTSLENSFNDYRKIVKAEAEALIQKYDREIRVQKIRKVIWSIGALVGGLLVGFGIAQIF